MSKARHPKSFKNKYILIYPKLSDSEIFIYAKIGKMFDFIKKKSKFLSFALLTIRNVAVTVIVTRNLDAVIIVFKIRFDYL